MYVPLNFKCFLVYDNDIIGFGKTNYLYQVVFSNDSIETNEIKPESVNELNVEGDQSPSTSPVHKSISESSLGDDLGSDKVEEESDNEEGPTCSGPSLIPKRKPCEYGAKCYRRNPIHKKEMSHPGDPDYWDPVNTSIDPHLDTRPG